MKETPITHPSFDSPKVVFNETSYDQHVEWIKQNNEESPNPICNKGEIFYRAKFLNLWNAQNVLHFWAVLQNLSLTPLLYISLGLRYTESYWLNRNFQPIGRKSPELTLMANSNLLHFVTENRNLVKIV